MSEREAFEAWAVNQHWFKDLNDPANGLARYKWSDGRDFYKVRDIDCMWNGWSARAAIEAQRVPDGAEATAYRYCHRCGYKSETVVITKAAAPPVAQPAERKPLSEEQIREAVTAAGMMFTHPDLTIARAIERAHGIGD